ncbi:MAG: hypothetical protein Q8P53_03520 [Candidatus Shapirobacteria bacterium]|nr:hypothetical protein [Candidatus Shapirobacteria bacterium]
MNQNERMVVRIKEIGNQINTVSAGIRIAGIQEMQQREKERLEREEQLRETEGLCRESGLSGIFEELRDSRVVGLSFGPAEIRYTSIRMGEKQWWRGVRLSFDFPTNESESNENKCWVSGVLSETGVIEEIEWKGRDSGMGINKITRSGTILVENDLGEAVFRAVESCIA